MACEVFKIVNKLSPEYTQDMISIKTSTYNFRGERKADIPRYGLIVEQTTGQKSSP